MNYLVTAKIRCCKCGKIFDVYYSLSKSDDPIVCPECLSQMDNSMAEKVINLMGAVNEINNDFVKYASEWDEPRFIVSVDNDRL